MRGDHCNSNPPVVVQRASAAPTSMPAHYVVTPSRPPAISIGNGDHRSQNLQRTPPPGSPMDIDFEGKSPSSASPSPSSKSKKPVISVFDWDDTLCPSSWLYREGLLAGYGLIDTDEPLVPEPSSFGAANPTARPKKRRMHSDDLHALQLLEDRVLSLIHTARHFGPVFIVTAAKLHWVRNCAECFLPNVLQVLIKSDSVHVISAREFYLEQSSRMGPNQSRQAAEGTPLAWKSVTFEALCAHLRVEEFVRRSRNTSGGSCTSGGTNNNVKSTTAAPPPVMVDFVSVGDSLCERDACRLLAMKGPTMLQGKTLKFLDQPTLIELIEQVKMTKALFDQICRHAAGLDLHVTRSRSSLQVVQLETPSPSHTGPPGLTTTTTKKRPTAVPVASSSHTSSKRTEQETTAMSGPRTTL